MVLKCKNVPKAINYALQDCSRLFAEQLGSPGQRFGQGVIMLENVIKLIGFGSALTHVFVLWSKGELIVLTKPFWNLEQCCIMHCLNLQSSLWNYGARTIKCM